MILPVILIFLAIASIFFVVLMLLNIKVGLFVFFATLPFQNIYFPTPFMFISISDIFAGLILVSWLILVLAGRMELPKTKALIFPAVFWVLSLLGCLTSIEPVTSLRFTFRLLSYFTVFIVLLSAFTDLRVIRLVLYAMALQLLIVSIVTNWKYLSSDIKIEDITDVDEEFEHGAIRKGGIEQNMNTTAYNLTMLMPLVFGLGLIEKKKYVLLMLPIALAALLITMSRGGWIAFALSLFFLPQLRIKQILVIVAVSGIVFSLFYMLFFGRIEATNLETESVEVRLKMYKFGWQLMSDNPILGIGIGNFTINAYRQYPLMVHELPGELEYCSPHNQYLGLLAENGILGFFMYLWFLYHISRYAAGRRGLNNPSRVFILRKCVYSSFVVILVCQMFTYFGLRNYLYWGIIALIYCLYDIAERESKTAQMIPELEPTEETSSAFSEEEIR